MNDDVCHPFKYEDILFMHNGMLADFSFGGAAQKAMLSSELS